MRMEELADKNYIKSPDTVERYLLNLVEQYFKNNTIAENHSKEYIIQKAVERMREELSFDNIGVLSIILPNGEEKTGAVTIQLEDLNGEPLIPVKHTAFNVPFGTEQNTACEGNDSRLSDARIPLNHTHSIHDIVGLEGILSTLNGKTERINHTVHEHQNKKILDMLVYTGERSNIDLTILETLDNKVNTIMDSIRKDIASYKQEIQSLVQSTEQNVNQVKNDLIYTENFITNQNEQKLQEAKDYTNSALVEHRAKIQSIVDNLISNEDMTIIKKITKNIYTLVGTMKIPISNTLSTNYSITIPIQNHILEELKKRKQSLLDCEFHIFLYRQNGNQTITSPLPYYVFEEHIPIGILSIANLLSENKLEITYQSKKVIPDAIRKGTIIYTVFSRENIS